MPRYGDVDFDYAHRLSTTEPDGPIYMLNFMRYRDEADYGAGGERGVSGREADDRYAPLDVLTSLGASVCFFGDVEASTEDWHRVAVVRYPTRRSFIEMQSRDDFQKQHVHKEAGMQRTIVMGTLPRGDFPADAPRVLVQAWAEASDEPDGDESHGDGATFDVEGTIVGDGRRWQRVSFVPTESADLPPADPSHQAAVVRPAVNRWS